MASRLKLVIINFFKKHRIPIFFIALAAIVLPEITVYFHRPNRGFDIYGYLNAGNDALKLENLYRISEPGKNNTWPPFFSFFCVPLALSQKFLGLPVTKELWYFFNFMAFILAMQMISLLLYKKKPSFLPGNDRFDFTSDLVFVPFFLILPGFIKNFFMLQINMFVLFLVIAGFFLLHPGKKLGRWFILWACCFDKSISRPFSDLFPLEKTMESFWRHPLMGYRIYGFTCPVLWHRTVQQSHDRMDVDQLF